MKKKHFSLLLNLLLSSTLFWGVPAAGDPSIETERANLATKVAEVKGQRAMDKLDVSGGVSGKGAGDRSIANTLFPEMRSSRATYRR